MFVTQDDFNLIPYNLVGLPEDDTFDDFISAQEEEHLRKLLGNLFYDALVEAVESFPDTYDETVEYAVDDEVKSGIKVYKSLVDANMGNELTDGTKWEEQVVDTEDLKWYKLVEGENYVYNNQIYKWFGMRKMVQPLIYSLWLETEVVSDSSNGKTQIASENSEAADSGPDICKSWNKFIDFAAGIRTIGGVSSMVDSLYGYLYSVSDSFDEYGGETLVVYIQTKFTNPGRKNIFDF